MKKAIIVIATFLHVYIFGQTGKVGINTYSPERQLDINGKLRIRTLKNQSENGDYSKILVANKNTGDVDYLEKKDFLPPPSPGDANKEVFNSIYNSPTDTADDTKTVTCGKFVFLFAQNGTTTDIKFKLSQNPEEDVQIYVSMEQNWDGNGFQFYQGNSTNNTNPFTFTSSNWNIPQSFPSANVASYEQNVIHLQYPEISDFYKLAIYKAEQSIKINNGNTTSTSYDFVTVCKKF